MQFKHTSDLMSFILIWNGTFLDFKKIEKNNKIDILTVLPIKIMI